MAEKYQRYHPLTLMFWAKRWQVPDGMRWLRERGHVCELCERPEDVAPVVVLKILDLAKMPMMAGKDFRRKL